MKKSILSSAEIKFFIQATEDEEGFTKRVSEVFMIPLKKFEKTMLEGHFGNPIISFRMHLRGEIADKLGSKILSLLLEKEKKILLSEISNHIDKHGSLYLRIDKQSIFSNRLIQSSIDPLRVKMKIRPKLPPQEMIKSFWRLLSIPN